MTFKIGDKVRHIGGGQYHMKGYRNPIVKNGDILTISAKQGSIYGFEEDTESTQAHWCNVEKNFELAGIIWEEFL